MDAHPLMISFIIPAYNEESLIGQTIDRLQLSANDSLGGQAHEIIVVDDASTDDTAAIAREHGARVITVHRRQIAAARNAGAREARGDVFIFVDADTLVPEATLGAALEELRAGAVAGGAAVRFDDQVSIAANVLAEILVQAFIVLRTAAGCFIFCTRQAFEAAGGFDERFFASEEIWISKALKRQGRFAMVREPVVTSGRKIRMHGLAGILWRSLRVGIRGPKGVQRREGLELWYDGRRE
jgi:glycosyltransferase involved in cell wall biosynthesis